MPWTIHAVSYFKRLWRPTLLQRKFQFHTSGLQINVYAHITIESPAEGRV